MSTPIATVFLASRFAEFADLRAELRREIAKAGYAVVDLNDGTSVPMSATDRSVSRVKDADILLLLLGTTYSENDDPDYVSVTHQEFRVAREAELPVLAFTVEGTNGDARLLELQREVQEVTVVGRLAGGTARETLLDDADRILLALSSWGDQLDGAEPAAGNTSFTAMLDRELAYLGLGGLASWLMPQELVMANQQYAQLVEYRGLAVRALEARDRSEARRLLSHGHAIYPYDWSTSFLLARLLETRGQNTDLAAAAKVVDQAGRALDQTSHLDWAPQTLRQPAMTETRRRTATLDLASRIARRRGDLDKALDDTLASLQHNSVGQTALVERVRLHALRGDTAAATEAGKVLLSYYPDRAVRLMRDPDLEAVQPALEQDLIAVIVARHRQAERALGLGQSEEPSTTRLRDAVTGYRNLVTSYRGDVTDAVAALTDSVARHNSVQAAAHQADSRVAELERQYGLVERVMAAPSLSQLAADDRAAAERRMTSSEVARETAVQSAELRRNGAFRLSVSLFGIAVCCMFLSNLGTSSAIGIGVIAFAVVALVAGAGAGVFAGFVATVLILLIPSWPWWVWSGPALTALFVSVGLAVAHRRRASMTAGDRVDWQQRWLVETESGLAEARAVAEDRWAEARDITLAARAHAAETARRLNLPVPSGESVFAIRALLLANAGLRLNEAFSSNPSWGFRDYVPTYRARPGDLTRDEDVARGSSTGIGSKKRRMVVVEPSGGYSADAVFGAGPLGRTAAAPVVSVSTV